MFLQTENPNTRALLKVKLGSKHFKYFDNKFKKKAKKGNNSITSDFNSSVSLIKQVLTPKNKTNAINFEVTTRGQTKNKTKIDLNDKSSNENNFDSQVLLTDSKKIIQENKRMFANEQSSVDKNLDSKILLNENTKNNPNSHRFCANQQSSIENNSNSGLKIYPSKKSYHFNQRQLLIDRALTEDNLEVPVLLTDLKKNQQQFVFKVNGWLEDQVKKKNDSKGWLTDNDQDWQEDEKKGGWLDDQYSKNWMEENEKGWLSANDNSKLHSNQKHKKPLLANKTILKNIESMQEQKTDWVCSNNRGWLNDKALSKINFEFKTIDVLVDKKSSKPNKKVNTKKKQKITKNESQNGEKIPNEEISESKKEQIEAQKNLINENKKTEESKQKFYENEKQNKKAKKTKTENCSEILKE